MWNHHAYVIVGDVGRTLDALLAELEHNHGVSWRGNPDVWREELDTFGIDTARYLAQVQSRKAFGERKIIIAAFQSITHEAQNALLKVLEEPTLNTHFFLITPSDATFLPTLRSRLAPLHLTNDQQPTTNNQTKVFLASTTQTRLEIIRPLIDEKNKAEAINLLNALEEELYSKQRGGDAPDDATAFALGELVKLRGCLRDRAPSMKMILEHAVLIVPRL